MSAREEPSKAASEYAREIFEVMHGRAPTDDDDGPIAELALTFHAAELTARTMVAAEREACAKIPEGLRGGDDTERAVLLSVARAIRARGAS